MAQPDGSIKIVVELDDKGLKSSLSKAGDTVKKTLKETDVKIPVDVDAEKVKASVAKVKKQVSDTKAEIPAGLHDEEVNADIARIRKQISDIEAEIPVDV
jgi:hypothetical protein